jgi:predicted dienelactone hydrolase
VRDAAAQPGDYVLIVFSHHSGGNRRIATFLCSHLASHGYVVAALDHSEVVAAELAPKDSETEQQRTARAEACVANRVPDIRFLIDYVLHSAVLHSETNLNPAQIGIVGHSLGGWTALAAPEVEQDIRPLVACGGPESGGHGTKRFQTSLSPAPVFPGVNLNHLWAVSVP